MIIIEDKTKEAIVYIPKTGKAQEPKPSEMTITENGLYEVAGRYNINVDVEGGGNNEELLEEIEQLENEIERLEDVNTALSTENDTLENELEKAGIDNENLRSEIETLENSIEVLQGEKSALEAEKRALEEQLEGANSNIEELNNQIVYLNNEITILNDRITTLTNEKKELQKELDKVQKKYDELNNGVYDFRFPDDWAKEHSDIISSSYNNFFYSPDNTNEKRVVISLEDLRYDEGTDYLHFKDCTVVNQNGRTLQNGSTVDDEILIFTFTGNYFSFEILYEYDTWDTKDIHITDLDKTITHIYTTQLDFNGSPRIELTDCPSNDLDIYVNPYRNYAIDYGDSVGSGFESELPYWGQQNQITKNGRSASLIPIFEIDGSPYNPCGSVISGLNEQIDQLKEEKESLQKQIYNKDREIQSLNTEISNLNNRINTLSNEKSALQSQVRRLQSQLNTANENIANLQSEINTLNNTVNTLTSEKEALQNQLNDATDRILELDTQISTLETQVDELNGQVSSLTTQLEEKQVEYDTLNQTYQTEVSNLQGTIEEKNAEILRLNTEIVDFQDDIQNYVADIERLNGEISTLNDQINTLLLEKQQLTTQVETLQNQINSLAEITITENGVYTPNEGVIGYKKITVDVVHFETRYITQAAYNSLSVKENNVFYLING